MRNLKPRANSSYSGAEELLHCRIRLPKAFGAQLPRADDPIRLYVLYCRIRTALRAEGYRLIGSGRPAVGGDQSWGIPAHRTRPSGCGWQSELRDTGSSDPAVRLWMAIRAGGYRLIGPGRPAVGGDQSWGIPAHRTRSVAAIRTGGYRLIAPGRPAVGGESELRDTGLSDPAVRLRAAIRAGGYRLIVPGLRAAIRAEG